MGWIMRLFGMNYGPRNVSENSENGNARQGKDDGFDFESVCALCTVHTARRAV